LMSFAVGRHRSVTGSYSSALEPSVTRTWPVGSSVAVAADVAKTPGSYVASWMQFDNTTGETRRITETRSATTTIEAPSGLPTAADSFVAVDISADAAAYPTWNRPIRTYFRRHARGWTLVGLERLPGKTPMTTTTTTTR